MINFRDIIYAQENEVEVIQINFHGIYDGSVIEFNNLSWEELYSYITEHSNKSGFTSISIENLINVTNTNDMFSDYIELTTIDISNSDFTNLVDKSNMFYNTPNLLNVYCSTQADVDILQTGTDVGSHTQFIVGKPVE